MSGYLDSFSISMFLGFGIILLILWGIMTGTNWISFRLAKVEHPKWLFLFAIAFLQILLGGLTLFVVRAIKIDPFLDVGTCLGITLLSSLFFIKLILKYGWKPALRIWGVVAGLQLVLLPVCSLVMLAVLVNFSFLFYPPPL